MEVFCVPKWQKTFGSFAFVLFKYLLSWVFSSMWLLISWGDLVCILPWIDTTTFFLSFCEPVFDILDYSLFIVCIFDTYYCKQVIGTSFSPGSYPRSSIDALPVTWHILTVRAFVLFYFVPIYAKRMIGFRLFAFPVYIPNFTNMRCKYARGNLFVLYDADVSTMQFAYASFILNRDDIISWVNTCYY